MEKLDAKDVDLLLQALDSHASAGVMGEMLSATLGTMMISDKDERDKYIEHQKKSIEDETRKRRRLDEEITLVKAKLLYMRRELDSSDAQALIDSTQS
jgi:hypothetical protein